MSQTHARMSSSQIEAFLSEPRFAVAATIRASGPPQVSTVWFLYENGLAYLSIGKNGVKHRNLQATPQIALCISGTHPDARSVKIYGTVTLAPDLPGSRNPGWRLVRRYFDSDGEAQAYLDSYEEENVLAIITPTKIIGEDYN